MFHRISKFALCACLVVSTAAITGCGNNTAAKKLDVPDDVDWAAIEAQGEEMNAEQQSGE
ncbi:MAG: hypothetical protein MI861_24755 [Pirellulales bacterium]|nr:hypothetical protein [Pirellulales bacterium]